MKTALMRSGRPKTIRIRTLLVATDKNGLKRGSALTSRVRLKGKRLSGKFKINRHSRAKVVCDEKLKTSIKSTRRSSLKKLASRSGRPGQGVAAGKSAWKLLVSKDVDLSAEKTRSVTLSIKSKRLRRKLSRAYSSAGNRKIRAKLIIRGRTATGVRDYSSQTVTLRAK